MGGRSGTGAAGACASCGAPLACGRDGQAVHPDPCRGWLAGRRMAAPGLFGWQAWDVRPLLPDGWQRAVLDVAAGPDVTDHWLMSGSVTSRESGPDVKLLTHVVPGDVLAARLPWLHDLYTGPLTGLAQQTSSEELSCAADIRYGAVLNVQREGERYEAHVDSQPRQGLLYLTSHPEGIAAGRCAWPTAATSAAWPPSTRTAPRSTRRPGSSSCSTGAATPTTWTT